MTRRERRQRDWLVPLGVLGLLVLASLACRAGQPDPDGFTLQPTYELGPGEQRDGDQVIMAYEIELAEGSAIAGDVTLTGSRATLNGEVSGDVVAVADRLMIGATAHITGDLVVCARELVRDEGARIDGELREECADDGGVSAGKLIDSVWNGWRGSPLFRLGGLAAGALFSGALAALIALLLPRPLQRMGDAMRRAPASTGGMGCLTFLVALGLSLVYALSLLLVLPLILLPFVVAGWLVIGLLSMLGWAALAGEAGEYLLRALHLEGQPRMVAAAVGGVALSLALRVWNVVWFTAWIGSLASLVVGAIGLGAVILTRAGTRPYPHPGPVSTTDEA